MSEVWSDEGILSYPIKGVVSFKEKEVFCDVCGESCMHEGHNYIGICMDISGAPLSLRNKVGVDKLNTCYPCWIKSMDILKGTDNVE